MKTIIACPSHPQPQSSARDCGVLWGGLVSWDTHMIQCKLHECHKQDIYF